MRRVLAALLSLSLAAPALAGGLAAAPRPAARLAPAAAPAAPALARPAALVSLPLAARTPTAVPLPAAPEPGRAAAALAARFDGAAQPDAEPEEEDLVPGGGLDLITGVSGTIAANHVDSVPRAKLHRAALRGMVVKSGRGREPGVASYFKELAAAEAAAERESSRLDLSIMPDGSALVDEVDSDSPVGRAGLRAGDLIVAVGEDELAGAGGPAAREAIAEVFTMGGRIVVERTSGGLAALDIPSPGQALFSFFQSAAVRLGRDMANAVETLGTAALKGMGDSMDRFTAFFGPKEHAESEERMDGDYKGIGVVLDSDPGRAGYLYSVTEGGPADAAGLKPGDKILEIGGVTVAGEDIIPFKDAFEAQKQDAFSMLVERGGERIAVDLRRVELEKHLAKGRLVAPGVGYLYVSIFADDVTKQVRKELRRLKAAGATKLVLDLRFNGGGLGREAVLLSSLFLPRGKEVFTQRSRSDEMVNKTPKGSGEFADMPLAVLVNGDSASASEITAAALQDHGRALVVGEPTHGKGSGQYAMELPYGAELHLTTFRWYTPAGRSVEKRESPGVQPDVLVEGPADEDAMLDLYVVLHRALDGKPDVYNDVQLKAAVEALASLK